MSRLQYPRALAAGVLIATLGLLPAIAATMEPVVSAATAGSWSTETPSGVARQEVTYVAVGSTFYLAGGKSTVQQAFNSVTHTWKTVAPLPFARDHIGGVALNGKVYYVGSLSGYPGPSFGEVSAYDPVSNTMTSAAPMPTGRDRGAAGVVAYQGKIYVAGGFHNGASVAFFDVYDPVTNAWTSLTSAPDRRDHVSAAVVGDRLYLIGGRTYGKGSQSLVDAYDFVTRTWIKGLAPLPTLRAGAATAVFGNEVLVIGGEGDGLAFNQVEAYDTTKNTWRQLTPMPTARHGIQAAVFNGRAYIADGGTRMGGGGATDVQQVFTMSTPQPGERPDCRVRLLSESTLLGNGVYNTTGAGQTRSTTAAAGATTTLVFSLENDSTVADPLTLRAPGSAQGFTTKYLSGLTGSTDVTAAVVAGTYRTAAMAPGGVKAVRLVVTAPAGAVPGTSRTWLGDVGSGGSPVTHDVCAAQVTVK